MQLSYSCNLTGALRVKYQYIIIIKETTCSVCKSFEHYGLHTEG